MQSFAGMPILRQETLDGVKFYLDNPEAKTKPNAAETWLLLRASGTEPLMRIYTESCSKEAVAKLLGERGGRSRWRAECSDMDSCLISVQ